MDLKNYVYTKISPETFYDLEKQEKQPKNMDDFIMGSEIPLLQPKKLFSKKQKVFLNTLDQLISVFIVTPLVVACWRGCWQLMDIYSDHFPTWEGFYVSIFAYLILALCQNILHHIVIEKEYPHWLFMTILNYLMKKFYIIFFFVITILNWRTGWLIMDKLCGVVTAPSGNAIASDGTTTSIWLTMVCSLLLFCMKCFSNVTSPPFSIGMDVDDEVFLFRTRYFTKVSEAVKPTAINYLRTSLPSTSILNLSTPQPFNRTPKGPFPEQFRSQPTRKSFAVKKASSNHNPKRSIFPRNIQDVISSISKNAHEESLDNLVQASSHSVFKGSVSPDILHYYKPNDPSEVNLMADTSFRFSPPIWKNFQKKRQLPLSYLLQETATAQRNTPNDAKAEQVKTDANTTHNFVKNCHYHSYPGKIIQSGDIDIIKSQTIVL